MCAPDCYSVGGTTTSFAMTRGVVAFSKASVGQEIEMTSPVSLVPSIRAHTVLAGAPLAALAEYRSIEIVGPFLPGSATHPHVESRNASGKTDGNK